MIRKKNNRGWNELSLPVTYISVFSAILVPIILSGCATIFRRDIPETSADRTYLSSSQTSSQVEWSPPDVDKLWNFNDPAATENRFRELLPAAETNDDTDYEIILLSQIARAEGLQERFVQADSILDRAKSLSEHPSPEGFVRCMLERGRVFNSSGKTKESIPFFFSAFEKASVSGLDFLAVDAAHMLAIVTPPREQLEWSEKAIDLAEKSNNKKAKGWLGPLYNNTGWTYHDLGQYEKALDMFEKSLEWNKQHGNEESIRIAEWCVGRAFRSLDRIEEAYAIQNRLMKEIEENGAQPDGYVYEELGECLLLMDRQEEAETYFGLAWKYLSRDPWLQENEPDHLARLRSLAGLDGGKSSTSNSD